MTINWNEIETKWQDKWKEAELGKAVVDKSKDKFFMIFAYPGVSGFLHVGHMRGFSYTDAICRFQRLQGKQVMFPVGTHASGNQAIAFANKVKNKDEKWIDYLTRNGYPKEELDKLEDYTKVIEYFNTVYVEDYWKKFGFLCDWDRFTSTGQKDYEKFIHWQFKKLQDKNLLIQKPYFATACVKCGPVAVDPSETDISKGGNAEKNEYSLLKFKLGEDYLVAATLRPETVYGQTNLWINPSASYVRVEVEGERWVMSREAAEKLQYQKDDVLLKEDVDPLRLIGQKPIAPGVEREVMILPATFCDPTVGSGLVTCVPSHAPFDWIALQELKHNKGECEKYGLDINEVRKIEPIALIKVKGWGTHPGEEICKRDGITSQSQVDKLEAAKKEIYKAEHHTGVMLNVSEGYAGMRVEQAKELMKAWLIETGKGDIFHDLSEEVICRCGNSVVIKRIDDQWFIKYSDDELTEMSKEHVKDMEIHPAQYKQNLPKILEWFSDRACTRQGKWIGSSFPFDEKWIIEPISDSTLYPCYYIVSKFVNDGTLKVSDLTEEFFDYVFLGKGEGQERWHAVKEEFDYFCPLDINLGGKEHQTVHFPVYLMNHVGILPPEKWAKGIFVNWWVTGKGSKISKSKGGAEPIPDAIEKYGVDAMRFYYAHIGSPHVDVIWDESRVVSYKSTLEKVYALVEELRALDGPKKEIDSWLVSRMHQHIHTINEAMKKYDLRQLASIVFFTLYDEIRWYKRRGGCHKETIKEVVDMWVRLMNPVTPHLSEELNDSDGLVSSTLWPSYDETKVDLKAVAGEELVRDTMEGMRKVLTLAKLEKAQKYTIFVSESWKYELFSVLHRQLSITRNVGEIIKAVLAEPNLKIKGKEVTKIVQMVVKDPSKLPHFVTSAEYEFKVMKDSKEFLEKEFGCSVEVIGQSDHPKAKSAMPGRVGMIVE